MDSSVLRKRLPASALLDPKIVWPAIGASVRKLDPRVLMTNPVMFVVEIVAALATILLIRDLATGGGNLAFALQIVIWLWFTVLFANFAEAVAEGRGKAQADALRETRTRTKAKRLTMPVQNKELYEAVWAEELETGKVVLTQIVFYPRGPRIALLNLSPRILPSS